MVADEALTLARAAVVTVGGGNPVALEPAQLQHGNVVVESLRTLITDGEPAGLLVLARSPLVRPLEVEDVVHAPTDDQHMAEAAIETLARVLAVEHRTGYSISSPLPYLGFVASDDAQLAPYDGKRLDQPTVNSRIVVKQRAGILHLGDALADRLDGVALLAQAVGQPNALGRYLDFVRLFEMGFATGARSLGQRMVSFLEGEATPHNFTKREVHTWMKARPRAAHAARSDKPVYLEADVAPWVDRMEEAAYDVLLNKADWRSQTTTRRITWQATTGSVAPGGTSPFATQGQPFSGQLQLVNRFDGRGAYPIHPADLRELLPAGLWAHMDGVLRLGPNVTPPQAGPGVG